MKTCWAIVLGISWHYGSDNRNKLHISILMNKINIGTCIFLYASQQICKYNEEIFVQFENTAIV